MKKKEIASLTIDKIRKLASKKGLSLKSRLKSDMVDELSRQLTKLKRKESALNRALWKAQKAEERLATETASATKAAKESKKVLDKTKTKLTKAKASLKAAPKKDYENYTIARLKEEAANLGLSLTSRLKAGMIRELNEHLAAKSRKKKKPSKAASIKEAKIRKQASKPKTSQDIKKAPKTKQEKSGKTPESTVARQPETAIKAPKKSQAQKTVSAKHSDRIPQKQTTEQAKATPFVSQAEKTEPASHPLVKASSHPLVTKPAAAVALKPEHRVSRRPDNAVATRPANYLATVKQNSDKTASARAAALAVDPNRLFCYWEVKDNRDVTLEARLLRIAKPDTLAPEVVLSDKGVLKSAKTYFDVLPGESYRLEIIAHYGDKPSITLATSNTVRTPFDTPAPPAEEPPGGHAIDDEEFRYTPPGY